MQAMCVQSNLNCTADYCCCRPHTYQLRVGQSAAWWQSCRCILPLQARHGGACRVQRTFLSLVEVHALPRDAVLGGEALLLADWLIWALVQGRGVEVAPPDSSIGRIQTEQTTQRYH